MKVAISQRIERKVSMMSVEQVSLEWYKKKFYKTILDRYREFRLAKESNLNYMISAPIIRMPGEIYFTLIKLSTPWRLRWETGIGNLMDTLNKEIERKANWARRYSRKIPDRGLADIFSYWVMDLMNSNYRSSLDLMLSLSLLLGVIAFWELTPQLLLEVEPTLIFSPEKIKLLKEIIMHEGCQSLNIDEGNICTCTQDPVNNKVAEEFQLQSGQTTEAERAKGRTTALAMLYTSLMIGIMLNTVATSHIMA